ncbi:MAG TPA: CBS domain-containing protein [Nitrososphaeraceae archaeon]|nr:CBS domain-containing protein [Nitrososphaeraceae archaeon]
MAQNLSLKLYDSLSNLSEQSVSNLMEKPLIFENDVPVSKAIGSLMERNLYESFLTFDKKLFVIGIRNLLNLRNITSRKISTIANPSPFLYSDSKIANAAHLMNYYRLRSLPVIEKDNKIIGQINAESIIKQIYELGSKTSQTKTNNSFASISQRILGKDIMTRKPFVIGSNDDVSSARNIMIKNRIDHIPVINENDNSLIGILTSTHIIQYLLPSERIGRGSIGINHKNIRLDFPVKSIMSKNVVVSNIDDSILEIINLIINSNSTYVVLQSVNEVHGIITFGDILTLLKERMQYELPCYIIGLPEDPIEAEMAKTKFIGVVKLLKKIFPEIEEARCRIKIKSKNSKKNRYEVNVNIITTAEIYSYTITGWDLPAIMDELSNGMKRKVIKEQNKKGKPQRLIQERKYEDF